MPKIDVLEPPSFSTSLLPTTEAQKEEWEGHFVGEAGSMAGFSFDLLATFHFFAGAIEGVGHGIGFPVGEEKITLNGVNTSSSTEIDIWLDANGVDKKPLVCIGMLDLRVGKIEGQFTVDCLDASSCGCGGGNGHFEMNRRRAGGD
ncbi:hypothetical protein [Bradyrhizobium guangdongense]